MGKESRQARILEETQDAALAEIREAFRQDFDHFKQSACKLPFLKRLEFCWKIMNRNPK